MSAESLFSINKTWEVLTLGEICKRGGGNVQTGPFGSQLHAADYVDEGIPSIMPKNIGDNRINEEGIARIKEEDADRLSKYLVREGDIIYSRRGDVERRALIRVREDGWLCGTGCLRIRFGEGLVYPPYAAYYLGHPLVREWIVRHAHGATMPNLNTSILSALPFVLPDMEEQIEIANIFDGLDNKIEINRQTNQTLENIAQAIFKSWFVDFEPTRAKIAARQAYHNLTPAEKAGVSEQHSIERAAICAISGKTPEQLDQLNPETQQQLKTTAALFPDALVESELGEVPEGWAIKPLSQTIELIGGGTPKRSEEIYWGGEIPWFSVKDAPSDGDVFVIDTDEKITELGLNKSSAKLLPEGVTIISARGTVGRLAMVAVPMAINQSCYGVKGAVGNGPAFNYFSLKQVVSTLKRQTHGAVFDTITTKTFDSVYVVSSSINSASEFERVVSPLLEKIKSNLFETKRLSECRDSLLPKLLSGEINLNKSKTKTEVAA